jgi:hypothetical protein
MEDKVNEFVNEFLGRYEKKKKIVNFILSVIASKPELKKDKNFKKAVIIFANNISDTELELMLADGVNVSQFLDLVNGFEEELIGLNLDLEDLEELESLGNLE